MSSVTYPSTNFVTDGTSIDFTITPVAPFWVAEVLIVLDTSFAPTAVLGKWKAGTQGHPYHLTIFVGQTVFDQLRGCLIGNTIDIAISYDELKNVTGVIGAAESLRFVLADLDRKLGDIAATFHAVKATLERRVDRVSEINELKKTGSKA